MYVDRFEQRSLAWLLVDIAGGQLEPSARQWLNAKIGAGNLEDALIVLVGCCMRNDLRLPDDIAATVRNWVAGYAGTAVAEAFSAYLERLSGTALAGDLREMRPAVDLAQASTRERLRTDD